MKFRLLKISKQLFNFKRNTLETTIVVLRRAIFFSLVLSKPKMIMNPLLTITSLQKKHWLEK